MADMPKLSVIVPVYNAETTLKECVDSIQQQTYPNYEVILIDDGSKDRSGELCDGYVAGDSRFKVVHTENQGVSSARNTGLEQASGKYIMFVDSDDKIYPDYFETYIQGIEKNQGDVVIGGLICVKDNNTTVKSLSKIGKITDKIWENICMHPEMYGYIAGKIMRLDIIRTNSIKFNTKMYAQEDLDFNLSVYGVSNEFETIDYAGYVYEYTPGKRKPPVWDFLSNSLKMYEIASQKIKLSDEAMEAIKERIVRQIFAFLYNCEDLKDYEFSVEKLKMVSGLHDYLKIQKINGESKLIIKWFLDEKYKKIYRYFMARKAVKKLMGKPV